MQEGKRRKGYTLGIWVTCFSYEYISLVTAPCLGDCSAQKSENLVILLCRIPG